MKLTLTNAANFLQAETLELLEKQTVADDTLNILVGTRKPVLLVLQKDNGMP